MDKQCNSTNQTTLLIVMGPSGCGKSAIGNLLAHKLDVPFIEGDQLHPQANIDKMSKGIPLDDVDRWPWLAAIREKCSSIGQEPNCKFIVVACSALKQSYRIYLRSNLNNIDHTILIYPKGSHELIKTRMSQRESHYMKASMLDSQLATLESPELEDDVVCVDINQPLETIVKQILDSIINK